MNRSFYIVFVPGALVAIGYIVVLRSLGFAPGYLRLAGAIAGFLLAIWIVRRKMSKKDSPAGQ